MERSELPFGLNMSRLSFFAEAAPALLLLEELLYAACLEVARTHPWRGAVKGTEVFPNTRGVEETFDGVWAAIESAEADTIARLHLDREVARRYFEARRTWDPEMPQVEFENYVCNFYFGCPTTSLEGKAVNDLVDNGVLVFHHDHWRPVSMGGHSIQILCAFHNKWKGSSLLLQPDVIFPEGT